MKKLILACLGIGISLISSAQIRPNFVYDDGTIQSGYFYSSPGFPGIYWSQGANPTPFSIDSTKRYSGIVAPVSMNSSKVSIPKPNCNVNLSGTVVNTAPGLNAPFVLTFGQNTVNGVVIPNTVDISSNPVLSFTYSKPATPASNFYVLGYTDGAKSNPAASSNPTSSTALGFLRVYPASATVFNSTTEIHGLSGTPALLGNVTAGFAASSPANANNNPLRVTIQVADSAGNKIELNSTVGGQNYVWQKLGFTMPTAATNSASYTVTLSGLGVLNYNSNPNVPNNPFVCANGGLGANGCPSVLGLSNVNNPSLFNFKKVARVLFFIGGGCAGNLSVATSLGICGYGVNYTCYDQTLTITSFSLGAVPTRANPPRLDSVKFSAGLSTVVGIYYKDPYASTTAFDSIIIARSVDSTSNFAIIGKIAPGYSDSNLPSTPNNSVSDYFGITTATGKFISLTGVNFTTTGAYYYKLGTSKNGLITWGDTVRGTNGYFSVKIPKLGIEDNFINTLGLHLAPNPTTGITSVQYSLTKPASIAYKVYNTFGSEVLSVLEGNLIPGTYSDQINLTGHSKGLYLIVIIVDGKPAKTEKLLLD